MQRNIVKKVVLDNFSKPTESNPHKNYAQAMIDGSITIEDLQNINSTLAFPANNYNRLKLPEGAYSSMEAMKDFVEMIGPHLSDAALFHITHSLAQIETDGNNTQAYRTSTLAKYFMKYEAARYLSRSEDVLPAVFLCHMYDFVLPLCKVNWSVNLENTINEFASFNLGQCVKGTYEAVIYFKRDDFDITKLDTQALALNSATKEFLLSLVKADVISVIPKDSAESDKPKMIISTPSNFQVKTAEFARIFKPALDKSLRYLTQELQRLQTQYKDNVIILEDMQKISEDLIRQQELALADDQLLQSKLDSNKKLAIKLNSTQDQIQDDIFRVEKALLSLHKKMQSEGLHLSEQSNDINNNKNYKI